MKGDWKKTTLNKMKKQDPNKQIAKLVSWARVRRDYVRWNTHENKSVGEALQLMEQDIVSTGYYLTWEVRFQQGCAE